MDNRIPLPTDNVFKFYALFGLLLTVFMIGSLIFITNSHNEFIFQVAVEFEELKADPARTPKQELRLSILDRQLEVKKSNKKFYVLAVSLVGAIGIYLMYYGFSKWHREIQPLQDELLRLNVEKLKREIQETGKRNVQG